MRTLTTIDDEFKLLPIEDKIKYFKKCKRGEWIAKCDYDNKEFPLSFDNVYDCQAYIDYMLVGEQDYYTNLKKRKKGDSIFIIVNNSIRCFNTLQSRWAQGLDF